MLNDAAYKMIKERGPRYAVSAALRPGQADVLYAATSEQAETIYAQWREQGRYNVKVHPPEGSIDLAELGRERLQAQKALDAKTAVVRAGVLRALEEGRTESEVARTAQVDPKTVRDWAGEFAGRARG